MHNSAAQFGYPLDIASPTLKTEPLVCLWTKIQAFLYPYPFACQGGEGPSNTPPVLHLLNLDSRGKWVLGFHLKRKCVTEFLFSGTPSTTQGGFLLSVWFQLFLPSFFSPAATDLRFASSVCVNHSQETLKICLQNTRTPIDPEAERK
jgi:hypothetical protein